MSNKILTFAFALLGVAVSTNCIAQFSTQCDYDIDNRMFVGPDGGPCLNTIPTAVPFLRIMPDARSGAMGDAAVALSPDANAMYSNASRLAFTEDKFQVSATYTPWLQSLGLNDVYLAYLSAYVNLDEFQTIGLSLTYFSLGQIDFISEDQQPLGTGNPNEFAISGAYARKLGERFSASLTGKFIYSNLANGQNVGSIEVSAGTALAADIGFLYKLPLSGGSSTQDNTLNIGLAASNLGTKITYTESAERDYIPANIGLGVAATLHPDDYNTFTLTGEVNKLLVPTPCLQDIDSGINCDEDGNGRPDYLEYSAVRGALVSFSDVPPGDSEANELMYSLGAEYTYNKQFSVRAGYFSEHQSKGNRKYLTLGAGFRTTVFGVNLSFLVPTTNQRSPLDNTLRISILYTGAQPGA